MIILTTSPSPRRRYESNVFISASNALNKHKSNSNIVCDGINDEQQVLSIIDEFKDENVGGAIQLSEGDFNFDDTVLMEDNISILGAGMGATTITQSASNKTTFDAITNCNYDGSHVSIKDLTLILPLTNSGDGINIGTRSIVENIRLGGGTPDSYGIRVTNAYLFSLRNIYTTEGTDPQPIQANMNPLLVECTDNLYNYGNAQIQNIQGLIQEDCTGITFRGVPNSHPINLIDVSSVNLAGRPNKTNQIGISLENVGSCSFTSLDLEQFATAIDMSPCRGSVFTNCYFDADENVGYDDNCNTNLFVGGHNPQIPINVGDYVHGGSWSGVIGGPPTSGTWTVGNTVKIINPQPGGYLGYVCIETGEPGLWKGFGLIEDD